MPLISKRNLSKKLENKLFDLFFEALSELSNPSDVEKFLVSLLSPVEKTMLAKRLGIAILLTKGYKYEEIKSTLSVSQETISKISLTLNYRGEGYKMVIEKMLKKEKVKDLLDNIVKATLSTFSYSSYTNKPADLPKTNLKSKF